MYSVKEQVSYNNNYNRIYIVRYYTLITKSLKQYPYWKKDLNN